VLREEAVRSSVFATGVLLGAVSVGFVDVVHASLRMPVAPAPWVFGCAWIASTGGLASVAAPLLLAHRAAFRAASQKLRVLLGAVETFVLAALGLLVEESPSIAPEFRLALTLCLTAGAGVVVGFIAPRSPRLVRFGALAAGCALLLWVETLAGRSRPWLRFSIDLTLLGACGAVWEGLRDKTARATAVFASLVAVVVAAPLGLLAPAVRGVVFEYGAHARSLLTWAAVLVRPPNSLGTVVCPDGPPRPSPTERARLSGSAERADVLFVSFDAMRWDHADSVPQTWRALGAHVVFTRAVSPAPRTEHSFAALLRGVPARYAPTRESVLGRPTIAEVLAKRGYRTVQVPTHRYFGPRYWMNDGFELAYTAEFPDVKKLRLVPADSALKKALEVARGTPATTPLLLWVHLMEGHEPYRFRGGKGPFAPEGQRRAFRDLDARVATFIREARAIRAGRPLVVAVFGDHGEEFGEHGGAFHSTTVYAEQVRVAFALAAPGFGETRIDAPVSLAALPATIVDLLGLGPIETFRTPSLLGCLDDRERCPDLAVSQMMTFGSFVAYTFERHRLLVDPEHGIERLFDSTSDPLEKHDLAPSEPALLGALRERARAFDRANCVPRDPAH
jgi:hypothetical protein